MKATSIGEAKKRAFVSLRSEIQELAEQCKRKEKNIQHERVQSMLRLLREIGIIDGQEFRQLGNEIGAANTKAAMSVCSAAGVSDSDEAIEDFQEAQGRERP